ncbi:MAG: hypothetical protein JXR96_27405 [Deltaproteobacteria bacterium]|nr:hypothetical protein [Deltaproteobacteria bacterium]
MTRNRRADRGPAPALLLIAAVLSAGPIQAEEAEMSACGSDEWLGRVDLFLGPQYYIRAEDQVQFSLGAEGSLRLFGPVAMGLSSSVGLILDVTVTAEAFVRLHLYRSCKLELALEGRGGIWLDASHDASEIAGVFSGGLELVHDLEGPFFILGRVSGGYVAQDAQGAFIDLVLGLGLVFE